MQAPINTLQRIEAKEAGHSGIAGHGSRLLVYAGGSAQLPDALGGLERFGTWKLFSYAPRVGTATASHFYRDNQERQALGLVERTQT